MRSLPRLLATLVAAMLPSVAPADEAPAAAPADEAPAAAPAPVATPAPAAVTAPARVASGFDDDDDPEDAEELPPGPVPTAALAAVWGTFHAGGIALVGHLGGLLASRLSLDAREPVELTLRYGLAAPAAGWGAAFLFDVNDQPAGLSAAIGGAAVGEALAAGALFLSVDDPNWALAVGLPALGAGVGGALGAFATAEDHRALAPTLALVPGRDGPTLVLATEF